MQTILSTVARRWLGCLLALWAGWAVAESEIRSPDEIPGTVRVDAEGLIDLIYRIPELTLIDSRVPMDRRQGYIEGSESLPDTHTDCDTLALHLDDLDAPVAFYCNGPRCGRSAKAAQVAVDCGYRRIYWFRGGFEEWLGKGYPVIKE
ncbi:rhodanese-like domain-containing protein [Thiohalobacter sp.]|uniref:rhodanese-like domain-containing protein n=1 Tax=Thiohalobacter sp. TaxID=2025948 RepID=UPI00262B1B4A|nr:rhodanese-like domain-containing protein [Thiohalobacter sp.]